MSDHQHEHHPWAQAAAVLGGVGMTAQSRANGELAHLLGNGWQAAVISFGSGLLLLLAITVFSPTVRRGVSQVRAAVRGGRLRWWQTAGGMVGALFVAVQSTAVPLVGVALFTVTIIGAQTGASLAVDRLGVGPQGVIQPTRRRVVAATLAVVAVLFAMSDRIAAPGFALWAIALAFLVGIAISFQHAINGLVSRAAGNALTAALANFVWGTTLLLAGFGIGLLLGWWQWAPLPSGPWWVYLGGSLGVGFITISAAVLHKLGSLRFVLGSVSGQLLGALLFDWLAPTSGSAISTQLLLGIAITAGAVVLANVRPAKRSQVA